MNAAVAEATRQWAADLGECELTILKVTAAAERQRQ
jgi:hypothetical protein